jgi:hypothetical protein
MNHNNNASRAFYECMYCHYSDRLKDPKLPPSIRDQFHQRQLHISEQYCMTFWSLHEIIIDKILKKIKMHNPHFPEVCTAMHTDNILHMAQIIERRIRRGEKCFIHSNDHRIALKDQDDVVICWIRISK